MSTATRRIKELESQLKEANRVILGLMEYAERAESTACAFAFELQSSTGALIPATCKRMALESFEEARADAGNDGKFFGG